jgi:hypothetical protein
MSAIAVPRSAAVEARTSLALASLGAGLIHVMAGFHHWSEWWLFGVGMFVMAVAQVAGAAALGYTGGRFALVAALVVNVAIVALWVWSRTTGLPFGPEPGEAEAIGSPDALCTATELVLLGGAIALWRGASDRALSRWSTLALVVFAIGAMTGFGHVGHHEH